MKSKIKYEEEIYPALLETQKGTVYVLFNMSSEACVQREMPCIIFVWWATNDIRIVAMSHQSLQ